VSVLNPNASQADHCCAATASSSSVQLQAGGERIRFIGFSGVTSFRWKKAFLQLLSSVQTNERENETHEGAIGVVSEEWS